MQGIHRSRSGGRVTGNLAMALRRGIVRRHKPSTPTLAENGEIHEWLDPAHFAG
jgi:hypothetical protein